MRKIRGQCLFDRIAEVPVGLHEVSECAISGTRGRFGLGDPIVNDNRIVISELPQSTHQFRYHGPRSSLLNKMVSDDDGSRVDQWIPGNAALAFELDDRIERRPRRLSTDPLPEFVTDAAQGHRQRENFVNTLDG